MRNPVTSLKTKLDGRVSNASWGDLVEARDGWLVVAYEAPDHTTERGEPVAHALQFFAEGRPLAVLVSFDERGAPVEYQCDACLPAELRGREIRWVDLDLDVVVGPDLRPRVRDHDDFARNAAAMGYDGRAIAAAEAGVNLALELLWSRAYPFDGSAAALLGRVLAASGPL